MGSEATWAISPTRQPGGAPAASCSIPHFTNESRGSSAGPKPKPSGPCLLTTSLPSVTGVGTVPSPGGCPNLIQSHPDKYAAAPRRPSGDLTGSSDPRLMSGVSYSRSRNACIHCTERNIECSGYPGPCTYCSSVKPLPLQCSFPLKRHKSDGQSASRSLVCQGPSSLSFDSFVDHKDPDAEPSAKEDKRDSPAVAGATRLESGNMPVPPSLTLSKINIDMLIHMTTFQVIDDLKANHFLRPSVATSSSFRNQGYYRHWIALGVGTWIKALGVSKAAAEFHDFATLFSALQESGNPETSWNLDIVVLKKLFWLSGSGFTIHDRTKKHNPRMVLPEFCLLLMWMGPADMVGIMTVADAVCMIYNWITASKDRVCVFQGLCSRQSAISTLRFSSFNCVYHLNEGRMECSREFPADYRVEFFCRNLVCTTEVNPTGLIGAERSSTTFRHDLMVDITKIATPSTTPSVTPCPK